ncbi:hypothetical protein GCM10023340_02830 [Nocardioides marinquilinus]|uniref:CheW-like domain-containing protein n=1 Tax=Nocardioides marinquilinus TaxID=1210400 RepID=A0ABP9PAQ8_9ACTN
MTWKAVSSELSGNWPPLARVPKAAAETANGTRTMAGERSLVTVLNLLDVVDVVPAVLAETGTGAAA